MLAVELGPGSGPDRLQLVTLPDPGEPAPGQIRVGLHATSINVHDYHVVAGSIGSARIRMSDGAGVVESVGEGVTDFQIGDNMVSLFFPEWTDGYPRPLALDTVPGDGIDGYARETALVPATSFTLAPRGYSHTEAASMTTAGVTAWRSLVVDAGVQKGDVVLGQAERFR